MITITRRQARRLRGVFRRSRLGIAHRGSSRRWSSTPRARNCGRTIGTPTWPSSTSSPAATGSSRRSPLPLDALADFEGRDEQPGRPGGRRPDRTVVRWGDRGIPQSREYAVPARSTRSPPFPERPPPGPTLPAGLLDALAEAAADRHRRHDPLRPGLHPAPGRAAARSSPPTAASS